MDYKKELESIIGENMLGGLRRYIDDKIPPGGFLTAVITNDLKEACGRADDQNRRIIFEYVAYLHNYCPANCWGSREKFEEYLKPNVSEE